MLNRLVAKVRTNPVATKSEKERSARILHEVVSNERHSAITAAELVRKWNIGIETARAILKATTQHACNTPTFLSVHNRDILQSRLKRLNCTIYTDNMFGSVKCRRARIKRDIPRRLWDNGMAHGYKLRQYTARGPDFRTPYEEITGETTDISEWVDFQFYDWVWYSDQPGNEDNPKVGRWLGVSHRVGASMCCWVPTSNGNVLSRLTVQKMTRVDRQTQEKAQKVQTFTKQMGHILSDDNYQVNSEIGNPF